LPMDCTPNRGPPPPAVIVTVGGTPAASAWHPRRVGTRSVRGQLPSKRHCAAHRRVRCVGGVSDSTEGASINGHRRGVGMCGLVVLLGALNGVLLGPMLCHWRVTIALFIRCFIRPFRVAQRWSARRCRATGCYICWAHVLTAVPAYRRALPHFRSSPVLVRLPARPVFSTPGASVSLRVTPSWPSGGRPSWGAILAQRRSRARSVGAHTIRGVGTPVRLNVIQGRPCLVPSNRPRHRCPLPKPFAAFHRSGGIGAALGAWPGGSSRVRGGGSCGGLQGGDLAHRGARVWGGRWVRASGCGRVTDTDSWCLSSLSDPELSWSPSHSRTVIALVIARSTVRLPSQRGVLPVRIPTDVIVWASGWSLIGLSRVAVACCHLGRAPCWLPLAPSMYFPRRLPLRLWALCAAPGPPGLPILRHRLISRGGGSGGLSGGPCGPCPFPYCRAAVRCAAVRGGRPCDACATPVARSLQGRRHFLPPHFHWRPYSRRLPQAGPLVDLPARQ